MAITIALIIMAGTIIYFLLRRYVNRLIVGSVRANTQVSKVIQEIVEEVNALIVEFNGITDRNVTIVEEKIARLSSLVDKSRHAITILSSYSFDTIESTHTQINTLQKPDTVDHRPLPINEGDRAHLDIDDKIDEASNYSVSTVHRGRSTLIQDGNQRHDIVSHIKRLHQQQTDIASIAKQVGVPISEVETYISLFDAD